jgi:hypothetical protein
VLQWIKKKKFQTDEFPVQWLVTSSLAGLLLASMAIAVAMTFTSSADAAADLGFSEEPPPLLNSPAKAAPQARGRAKCAECGVIGATRQIGQPGEPRRDAVDQVAAGGPKQGGGKELTAASKIYEVTVRMQDGSSRTFMEANPAHWREGERVIFFEGPIALID